MVGQTTSRQRYSLARGMGPSWGEQFTSLQPGKLQTFFNSGTSWPLCSIFIRTLPEHKATFLRERHISINCVFIVFSILQLATSSS